GRHPELQPRTRGWPGLCGPAKACEGLCAFLQNRPPRGVQPATMRAAD
ncbi:hypothetical protein ABLN97_17990, partial [Mycobacterium tuberculosis]